MDVSESEHIDTKSLHGRQQSEIYTDFVRFPLNSIVAIPLECVFGTPRLLEPNRLLSQLFPN